MSMGPQAVAFPTLDLSGVGLIMVAPMRYVLAGLALVILVGGLAAVKVTQISSLISMGKQMQKLGPPPESVATAAAQDQTWGGSMSAVGTIESVKGVAISNEVPGIVAAIRFE